MEKSIDRFAHIISGVFSPLFMPFAMVVTLLMSNSLFALIPRDIKFYTIGISFLFLVLFPLLGIIVLKRMNIISHFDMILRHERTYPLLISLISVIIGYFVMRQIPYVPLIGRMYLVFVVLLSSFSIITFWWKISMHMSAIGAYCGFVYVLGSTFNIEMRGLMIISIFIAGLVGFARLRLRRHTPMQVLLGTILGFSVIAFLM